MTAHILLIEDDSGLTKMLELELLQAGYQVSIAHEGRSGLELAQSKRPDLILIDWKLPFITGLDVCSILRSTGNVVPVIFISAKCALEDQIRAIKAGANDYITKPFQINELLSVIVAHLQERPIYQWHRRICQN